MSYALLCGMAMGCAMPTAPTALASVEDETAVPAPYDPIIKRQETDGIILCEGWVLQPITIDGRTFYEWTQYCP